MFPADAKKGRLRVEILVPALQVELILQETVMKTAKWLIPAICVLSAQFTFGQYDEGVPPIYLPEATESSSKTVSRLKSNTLVRTGLFSNSSQPGAMGNEQVALGTGCTSCDGGCNDQGLICDSGCQSERRPLLGRSFFGSRTGPCGGSALPRFKINVNRGPQACNNCGADQRTFLQRILPVSVSVRTNHESEYTSFFGGYHDMQDIRAVDRLIDFDDSFIVGFARGRRFCGNIRFESEFAIRDAPSGEYFQGSFVGSNFVPTSTNDVTDGLFIFSSMRNVLYDFNDLGTRIKPYVGLGFGGVFVTGDVINTPLGRADWINDNAFAYQFIVGATRKFNTRSEGYVEFRHLGTSGLELENDAGDPFTEFSLQNNTVVFGLRFNRPPRTCCNK